ncbi:MAG: HAMP domain-containing histidine kinase [Lachnospiraceae bacterium]|nr:HAMP domain-containing histidine kinase [Lachnospiraceae bacterium]
MKKTPFLFLVILTFLIEIGICFCIVNSIGEKKQDNVAINECMKSICDSFGNEENYAGSLFYTVLDTNGNVIFQNGTGLSTSVNEAIRNNDTILPLEKDGTELGTIIFNNDSNSRIAAAKRNIMIVLIACSAVQLVLILVYFLHLKRNVLDPFDGLNDFAVRIAGGNLDIPLTADKKHVFGSFTEAFDLMRSELKKAKAAEKKANDDKKEMIAKLSHDIKTPVASIKSSSEIGYELAKEDKIREYFRIINEKSDQIKSLTDNLFNNAVNDITELAVSASPMSSRIIKDLIRNADHRHKAGEFDIPECSVFFDRLRLQQTFDNLFMNSYKYADTDIDVRSVISGEYLVIGISDHGPGVEPEELPLLKEKYKRGSNTSGKEGAGLGLFLADYFLTEMDGKLELAGENGFTAKVFLRIVN